MMKHYVGEVKDVVAQDFKAKWCKCGYFTIVLNICLTFVIFIEVLSTWED